MRCPSCGLELPQLIEYLGEQRWPPHDAQDGNDCEMSYEPVRSDA